MTEKTSKKYVIIVAGGSGTRMNSLIPKQFMKLTGNMGGKPVLMHTIERFVDSGLGPDVIVALPADQIGYWNTLCLEYEFNVPVKLVVGGDTRFQSVKNCLEIIHGPGLIAVHDAVRPLVSAKIIMAAYKAAEMYGNAVPAIPLNDSIRKIESGQNISVDRSRYCIIQTPQCFQSDILKKAYKKDFRNTFTDDASVVEAIGEQIHLIDGSPDNIKITTPRDISIAEAILKSQTNEVVK